MDLSKNKFFKLWLIIGIIAGFSAVIFFAITHLNEKGLCNVDCELKNQVIVLIILLSLFGMFVGSLTYYFIADKYERRITMIHKDATATTRFLEGEEKALIEALLRRKGVATQSELAKDAGIARVNASRTVAKLARKGVITKNKNGMTNTIRLCEELREALLD
ncbi:hypothetical protein JXA12_05045 [Candidatus Woesearchaeota archaeon]|nr:hypothetical protein [Candidatus Woesearchaeota archaeon]